MKILDKAFLIAGLISLAILIGVSSCEGNALDDSELIGETYEASYKGL